MNLFATFEGTYDAARAAALAGVPKSTVYDWARKKVIVPSISPTREKLWSYADLMGLRTVSWLRRKKETPERTVRATAMGEVRRALEELDRKGLDLWHEGWQDGHGCPVLVDPDGHIWLAVEDGYRNLERQGMLAECLNLMAPFEEEGGRSHGGPHLLRPREHLRIVPGKVAGQPHVQGTRLGTRSIYALAVRGYSLEQIEQLYPGDPRVALEEAIDLERQLERLQVVAA